ncbi:unnamed protein product [Chrysoparadoxa australica]
MSSPMGIPMYTSILILLGSLLAATPLLCHGFSSMTMASQAQDVSSRVDSVAIVGAGIGGLSLAIALQKLPTGVSKVQVFEKFPELRPAIGAGIQMSGGAAILAKFGIGDELAEAGVQVKRLLARTVQGRMLINADIEQALQKDQEMSSQLANGSLFLTIMRDNLLQILSRHVGDGIINFGKTVVEVNEGSLKFEDGEETEAFDLVIGADGIKGAVKQKVSGTAIKVPPLYSGLRIQFGVAKGGSRPEGSESTLHAWLGPQSYTFSATFGGIDRNYDMVASVTRGDPVAANVGWDASNVQRECIESLRAGGFPHEVTHVAEAAERFFQLGIYFQNPLSPWISKSGREVLLGDSAHAMPPNLGQGGNQAVQDAYCLAVRLAEVNAGKKDLAQALKDYETIRRPAATQLLFKSLMIGTLETLPTDLGSSFRDEVFGLLGVTGLAQTELVNNARLRV